MEANEQVKRIQRAVEESENYTPDHRRQPFQRFLKIMTTLTPEELAANPLDGRPAKISV